ncbi:hypothetical protein [Nannocystis punicea]|uniref:Uncharacterized protein n=1 Tax=Nannocystis punicea TaxID=2995304 RepID=A0ABY7HF69_9BACT|nr:hypothetical protein [Nannocystis poenicansa]WAS97614.1 hypothetical protein O0S08_15835 [Nannocystis poenicansa]
MIRRAAPLAAALAVTLACPEVFASPWGHVPANLSLRSNVQPTETTVTVETGPAPAAPAPAAPAPVAAPQPYADPAAAAPVAEGPQPYADPGTTPTVGYAPPPPMPRKRRKGLMIGGWVMFGSSYLATAFVAAIVHDTCNLTRNPNCKNAAAFSLIPAIGPFMAIPYIETDAITPKVLMAFPALVQIAGLTMGIIGTVQFVRDGREPRYVGVDGLKLGNKLRLGVAPTRFLDGGTLTLGARF